MAPSIIRRLGPADAEVWRTIRLAALEGAPDAFGQTLENAAAQPLSHFAKAVAGPDPIFAAFAHAAAIGTASVYTIAGPKTAHRGMLWGMYVAPAFRAHGVGGQLIDAVLEYSRGYFEQVHLRVVAGNAGAYALYRKQGFEAYGIEPRALCYKGRYHDEIMMVRMLGSKTIGAGGGHG